VAKEHKSSDEDAGAGLKRILPEVVKRGLERGIEAGLATLNVTDRAVRGVIGDANLPREVAGYLFAQIDESKNAVVRAVAKELRDFLEATDLSYELQKALTALSVEIKTEIRFVPNERAAGIKPNVKVTARAVKRPSGGRRSP
jgi:hypothetical protein